MGRVPSRTPLNRSHADGHDLDQPWMARAAAWSTVLRTLYWNSPSIAIAFVLSQLYSAGRLHNLRLKRVRAVCSPALCMRVHAQHPACTYPAPLSIAGLDIKTTRVEFRYIMPALQRHWSWHSGHDCNLPPVPWYAQSCKEDFVSFHMFTCLAEWQGDKQTRHSSPARV